MAGGLTGSVHRVSPGLSQRYPQSYPQAVQNLWETGFRPTRCWGAKWVDAKPLGVECKARRGQQICKAGCIGMQFVV